MTSEGMLAMVLSVVLLLLAYLADRGDREDRRSVHNDGSDVKEKPELWRVPSDF